MVETLLFQVAKFVLKSILKSCVTPELKEQARQKIYNLIPGDRFDEVAWNVIESLWDAIVGEAKVQVETLGEKEVSKNVDGVARDVAKTFKPLMLAMIHEQQEGIA